MMRSTLQSTPGAILFLYYGTHLVGLVREPFYSDDTWYGLFERTASPSQDPTLRRVFSFVDFCEQWHERLEQDQANPPDASEFDQFSDLLQSGLWFAASPE